MLDEYMYLQQKRRRARRWDFKVPIGSIIGSLLLAYLTTAALVGILAG
jgi:hypothetical protein